MKHINLKTLASGILAAGMLATPAMAANTAYAPGDLVLFFQEQGGSNTVYVRLGQTAADFRGSATGADATSRFDLPNIGATLTSAFGAGWANKTNLYAGLAGVWGNAGSLNSTLENGDPNRTLYVSQSRAGSGTTGAANSPGWSIGSDGSMTTAATAMINMNNNPFETIHEGAQVISEVGESSIDNNNLFLAADVQGTAFGTFAGGVQQAGTVGTRGDLWYMDNVEFALDLYRIQARNNISGQVGLGETNRLGSYEGTIGIDSLGNVSFMTATIPEPSSTLLAGLAGAAALVRRRRTN